MILRDARVLFGPHDFSADHHEINMTVGAAERDGTRFGHRAECVVAGLPTVDVTGSGFVRIGPGGTGALRQSLGMANVPITIMSGDPAIEDAAVEFFLAESLTFKAGAQVGNLYAFSWTAKGQGVAPVHGHSSALLTLGASQSSGAGVQLLPNVPVSVALHVLSVSGAGASLLVTIGSDGNSDFASETDQYTFAPQTVPGSIFARMPLSADTWWRARWSVTGTTPQISIAAVIGQ